MNSQTRIKQIEEEFQEPLSDILEGFRAMGYTWSTIAGALDCTERELRRMRELCGLERHTGKREYDLETWQFKRIKEGVGRLGFETIQDAILELHCQQGINIREVAAMIGCSVRTASVYSPPNAREFPAIKEKIKRVMRENRTKRNRPDNNHIWRRERLVQK